MRARLWRYVPLMLWIGFIFFASTRNFSAPKTSLILRPLLLWLFPDISQQNLVLAHMLVRKGAHFVEYAVLALLAARAFLSSGKRVLRRWWFAVAFGLVALTGLLDEYHQSFVPSRTGTIYDSLIDMVGGASMLAAIALAKALRARRRRRAPRPVARRQSYRHRRRTNS